MTQAEVFTIAKKAEIGGYHFWPTYGGVVLHFDSEPELDGPNFAALLIGLGDKGVVTISADNGSISVKVADRK